MDIELIKKTAIPVGAFLAGLYTPWIKWEIEKRREKRKYREGLIRNWHLVIDDASFNFNSFVQSSDYASLRSHISNEIVKELEAPRVLYVAGERGNVKKHMILDEIARLEKKWDLV